VCSSDLDLRPTSLVKARRMGAAWLFPPNDPLIPGRDIIENTKGMSPGQQAKAWRLGEVEGRKKHAPIDNYLTKCAASNIRYMNPALLGANGLMQGQHGWNVRYNDNGYCDFGGYFLHHAGEYKWNGRESATAGKQDIRAHNRKVTPHFKSLEKI